MLNNSDDLKGRIVARRQVLVTKLAELTADASPGAAVSRDRIKARLSLLDHTIRIGVKDRWDDLNDAVKLTLDDRLDQ